MSIAYRRKQLGLSQADVARKLGVDQSAVHLWYGYKTLVRVAVVHGRGTVYLSVSSAVWTAHPAAVHEFPGSLVVVVLYVDP